MVLRQSWANVAVAILMTITAAADRRQDATPQPAGTLAGRVVDGSSGRAIEGAVVIISSSGPSLTATTGSNGEFSIARPGGFARARISAEKPGYLPGAPGRLSAADYVASGIPFDVAPGERIVGLVVRMWPASVLTGQIVDEKAAPVAGAIVEVLTRIYAGSAMRWNRGKAGIKPSDDSGMYRVEGLTPADYLLMVRPPVPRTLDARVVQPTYFPGTNRITQGSVITVAAGEIRTVDVALVSPSRGAPLAGQLVGADRSMTGVLVHLAPLDMTNATNEFDETVAAADNEGRFRFDRVAEGGYRLRVRDFPRSDTPTLWRTAISTVSSWGSRARSIAMRR
jgi:hypothetical protein